MVAGLTLLVFCVCFTVPANAYMMFRRGMYKPRQFGLNQGRFMPIKNRILSPAFRSRPFISVPFPGHLRPSIISLHNPRPLMGISRRPMPFSRHPLVTHRRRLPSRLQTPWQLRASGPLRNSPRNPGYASPRDVVHSKRHISIGILGRESPYVHNRKLQDHANRITQSVRREVMLPRLQQPRLPNMPTHQFQTTDVSSSQPLIPFNHGKNGGFSQGNVKPNSFAFQNSVNDDRFSFTGLHDADIFDDAIDHRFDKGFSEDNFKVKDKLDDDSILRINLPETLSSSQTRERQIANNMEFPGSHIQTHKLGNGYYDRHRQSLTSPALFGINDDKVKQMGTNSDFHSFPDTPWLLPGKTGVNKDGGVGLLISSEIDDNALVDRDREDAFMQFNTPHNDLSKHEDGLHVASKSFIVQNAMNNVAMPPQTAMELLNKNIKAEHSNSDNGDDSDHIKKSTVHAEKDMFHHSERFDRTSLSHAANPIEGFELLGQSHPNMMVSSQIIENQRDVDQQFLGIPQHGLNILPFNPHSDESMDMTYPALEELGEGALALFGIDPATIKADILAQGLDPGAADTKSSSVSSQGLLDDSRLTLVKSEAGITTKGSVGSQTFLQRISESPFTSFNISLNSAGLGHSEDNFATSPSMVPDGSFVNVMKVSNQNQVVGSTNYIADESLIANFPSMDDIEFGFDSFDKDLRASHNLFSNDK